MSGQLFGGVIEWLRTPSAADLSDKERIVLMTIADRVMDTEARTMRRFQNDDCNLYDRLCQVANVGPQGLKKVLQRLAERGLEVRVVWRYDTSGNPVYAGSGHAMEFRLPELPATAEITAWPVDKQAV